MLQDDHDLTHTPRRTCRLRCSSRIASTSFAAYEGASAQRCCRMCASSVEGMSSTCSSRKRERKARESALRPAYAPGGFCSAKVRKG